MIKTNDIIILMGLFLMGLFLMGLLSRPVSASPLAPTNLSVASVSARSLLLTWTDTNNDYAGFVLERSSDGLNFQGYCSLPATPLAFYDNKLGQSVYYYYRIRAVGADGSHSAATAISSAAPGWPQQWPFTASTDANYSFDSSVLELVGGVVRLKSAAQTDADNTSTGFGGGSFTGGAVYDTTNSYVRLTSTPILELDSSWTPAWGSLVGYWKLNGTVGSISNGASILAARQSDGVTLIGTDGTANNANGTGMAYVTGQLGQGITFDGIDDQVQLPSAADLNSAAGSDQTFSIWLNPSRSNATEYILEKRDLGTIGFYSIYRSNNNVTFEYYNSAAQWLPSATLVAVPTGTWSHLVFVKQGSTNQVFSYLNGTLMGTASGATYGGTVDNPGSIKLGMRVFGDNMYQGSMDDLAIWNTALTATQVLNIYQHQFASVNGLELDPSWTPAWSNIVGYWKLDESVASTTAADSSQEGTNTGTVNGGVTFGTSGVLSTAATLNGTSGYINVPNSSSLTISGDLSVAAWVKPSNTNQVGQIVGKVQTTGNYAGYSMNITSADSNIIGPGKKITCYYRQEYGTVRQGYTLNDIVDGNWHHMVCAWNQTANSLIIYIDGSAVPIIEDHWGGLWPDPTNNVSLLIGQDGSSNYVDGVVDDIAVWNTTLSASAVASIYQHQMANHAGTFTSRTIDSLSSGQSWTNFTWTPTLPFMKSLPDAGTSESQASYASLYSGTLMNNIVGLWHFDETSSQYTSQGYFADSSPGGTYPLTIANTASPGVAGELGLAASFSAGVASSSTGINFNSGSSTYSAWAYMNPGVDTTGQHQIIGTVADGCCNLSIGTWNGALQFFGYVYSYDPSDSGFNWVEEFATIPPAGTWFHVVGVYDSTNQVMKFFVNGKLVASNPGPVGGVVANPWPVRIGGISSSAGYWNGMIDEAAMWDRALTNAEVLQLYRRGANRIKYQVRSCTDSACTIGSPSWQGPDNTNQTYFSELYNTTSNVIGNTVLAALPTMTFANFSSPALTIANNRYFQYRAILESDDANTLCNYGGGANTAACSPELKSAAAGPAHYTTTAPKISNATGSAFKTLSSFTETLGSNGCASGLTYAISNNNSNWYYWNGSAWTSSNSTTSQASSASSINSNIASFSTAEGTGSFYFEAFLNSNGGQACELDNLRLGGAD